jgi:PAS domain S-box-containing protein
LGEFMKIRAKLTLAFLGIALLLAIVSAVAIFYYWRAAETAAVTEAKNIALSMAHEIYFQGNERDTVLRENQKTLERLVLDLHNELRRDIEIVDMDGRIVADAVAEDIGTVTPFGAVANTLRDGISRIFIESDAHYPKSIRHIVVPIETDDRRIIGAIVLEYTPLYAELTGSVKKGAAIIAVSSIVCLALAIVLGGIVSAAISRRILELSNVAALVGRGDFSQGVIVRSDDEIGRLGTVFNEMIAARRGAEEKLREREEKLRSLTQIARDAIVVMDNDGAISFWNPAAEIIFGYSGSEAIGKELHAFIGAQKYYESYRKGFEGFRETGQGMAVGKTLELQAVRKGGEEFPIELSLSSIKIRDKWQAVGIIRDITERKRAADQIRKLNEDLERKVEERTNQLLKAQDELLRKEKLAMLGQLAGSVGHELRNPLGVINNAVYFLKTVMPGADTTVKEYLDIIKSEVNNSERIISDLLDFSRTNTPRTRPVGVRELISGTMERCIVPEGVRVEIEIQDAPPPVMVDPFQTEQVFQNLITNAVQAMPAGGLLRIAARGVSGSGVRVHRSEPGTLDPKLEADLVEISVSDTGEGISPENMEKLFQPLFTTKARGIGLGLPIAKHFAEANGGRMEVESEMGKGATFTVRLPAMRGSIYP